MSSTSIEQPHTHYEQTAGVGATSDRRLTVGAGGCQLPAGPVLPSGRSGAASDPGDVRHLRPRQRLRAGPGAVEYGPSCRTTSRATSRPWCTPRSASPRPEPARDAGLHGVDRSGRDQHDHRRGAATINRLPVLAVPVGLLRDPAPGAGASAARAPVSADVSVNDCFRPVSRFFDRIIRPEQLTERCRRRCGC